jgi:hypothetical protein
MPSEILPQDEHFQQVIPEASQESIDDFIKSLEDDSFTYPALTHLATGVVDEPVAEDEDDEEETTNEPVTPDETTTDDTIPEPVTSTVPTVTVRGQQVPLADLERLYEFDQFLKSDPDAAARVQQAVAGQPVVPAEPITPVAQTPQVVTPPDFLDLDDPVHKFLWEQSQSQQQSLLQLRQQEAARINAETERRANDDMATAISRFRAAHPTFNDDQINTLRQHGARMNIVGAVMDTTPSPVEALVRVLDIAAMDNADLRPIFLAPPDESPTPTRRQQSTTRKSKLNALGGSTGSVPRTTSTPRATTDKQAIDQFAKELAESFGQN